MNENYDLLITQFCTAVVEKIRSGTKFTDKSINKTISALENIIANRSFFKCDLKKEFLEEFTGVIFLCMKNLEIQPNLEVLLKTNLELLSLFGLNSQQFFLNSLSDQLHNIANNNPVYIPIYYSVEKGFYKQISEDDLDKASNIFFKILSLFLQRYTVKQNHHIYRQLASYLISSPPHFQLSNLLNSMMQLTPMTESTSWMLLLSLHTFILHNMDLFDTLDYLDYYCSACFTRFTKRISHTVLNNIGKNIVPFMTKFSKISTKAPKFLNSYFSLIGSFIKNDFDVALLCSSLISNCFKYYYMNDQFIDFCTSLATGYKDFWKSLLSSYGRSPEYYISLQKINHSFWPEKDLVKETPPFILLQLSLNKPDLDPEIKSFIWSNFDALLSTDSFSFTAEHYFFFHESGFSIDQYISNFPNEVLIEIFQSKPNLLTENMMRTLCRLILFDETKRSNSDLCRLLYLNDSFNPSYIAYSEVISAINDDKNTPFDITLENPINKIRAFYKFNSNDDEMFLWKLQEPEFKSLFRNDNCVKLVHALLDTHPFRFNVLSEIIEIISQGNIYEAANAFRCLATYPKVKEMYLENMCEVCWELTKLYQQNPVRFPPVSRILCDTSDVTSLQSGLIASYITSNNLQEIDNLAQKQNKVSIDLIKESLPSIFLYLTITTESQQWLSVISSLMEMTQYKYHQQLFSDTLPYCAGSLIRLLYSENITKRTKEIIRNNISNIESFLAGGKNFWATYLLYSLFSFRQILQKPYLDLKMAVLNALYDSISKIGQDLDHYYHPFFLVMQLAIETPELIPKCLQIWSRFFEYVKDITPIDFLFFPVILMAFTYYDENEAEAGKICQLLLIEQDYDFVVAHFRPFIRMSFNNEKLSYYYEIINISKEDVTLDQCLQSISSNLLISSPVLARLLLKQMLSLLKGNENFNRKAIIMILLKYINTDVPDDCILLAARCLSQLTNSDAYMMEDDQVFHPDDHISILQTAVTKYLIPLLNDTNYYEIAAFSIQNALTVQQLEFNERDKAIIQPFEDQLYRLGDEREPNTSLAQEVPFFLIKYIYELHQGLTNEQCILFKVLPACSVSIPLCRFLYPYLIYLHVRDPQFRDFLKDFLQDSLKDTSFHPSVKNFILSCYPTLVKLGINLGSGIKSNQKKPNEKQIINIGVDDKLIVDVAIQCDMYYLALKHFQFLDKSQQEISLARLIYENIDDPDELNYLKDVQKAIDSDETVILTPGISIESKIKALNNMVNHGSFRRALSDAKNLKKANIQNDDLNTVIAKAALRLQDWDTMNMLSTVDSDTTNFEQLIASLLGCVYQGFQQCFECDLQYIRGILTDQLIDATGKSIDDVFNTICKFRITEDLEDAVVSKKLKNWINNSLLSLDLAEIGTAVICAIQDLTSDLITSKGNKVKLWLLLSKLCRKGNNLEKATTFCEYAYECSNKYSNVDCIIERSKLLWAKGQTKEAIATIDIKPNNDEIKGKILFQKAKMTQEMQLAPFAKIKPMYEQSIKLYPTNAKAHYSLAQMCDLALNDNLSILENCTNVEIINKGRTQDLFGRAIVDTNATLNNFKDWIVSALSNYFVAIINKESLGIEILPRIFYLFFDIGTKIIDSLSILQKKVQMMHSDTTLMKRQEQLSNMLMCMFDVINKHVFSIDVFVIASSITLLISRINNTYQELITVLFDMIELSLRNYPDHTLWHLMYLQHSQNHGVANEIWEKAYSYDIKSKIDKFEVITAQLKELSFNKFPPKNNDIYPVSDFCPNLALSLSNCNLMVPSESNFLKKTNDFSRIIGMNDTITQFGSKQLPKIIKLKSEGKDYQFIVKKDKDMRKDMRMMEFCSYVNLTFNRDRRCKQRNFHITTYSVICLSEEASLIEWVDNTVTLFKIMEIDRNELMAQKPKYDLIKNHKDPEKRILEFRKMEQMYKPKTKDWYAMKFASPSTWFKAQKEYIHTTAIWSLVGYIIGLGDRHLENILLNEVTGGIVHVDFDLIFDKARLLQIPETVPFRLTQCIVDGLGIGGTSGSFNYSCSLVLEVLKSKKQRLLNVLQAFVDDPLLDSDKSGRRSTILLEIDRRLSCISVDKASVVTPDSAIQMLIDNATDPIKLSAMFAGWAPFV